MIMGQYKLKQNYSWTSLVITSCNLNNSIEFLRDVLSVWHTQFTDFCFCVVCDKEVELKINFSTTYFNCVNDKCKELLWLFLDQLAHPRELIESEFTDFR